MQGSERTTRVMKGALNGRSNYSPIATTPYFTGKEQALLPDPTVTDGIIYLRDNMLKAYDPTTRSDSPLVEDDVTAVARGPGTKIYFATASRKVTFRFKSSFKCVEILFCLYPASCTRRVHLPSVFETFCALAHI